MILILIHSSRGGVFTPLLLIMWYRLFRNMCNTVMMTRGTRIHVSHCLQAHLALSETIAFSQAVDVADSMTNPKNTLIVVTSDHSHTMTINGYPSRDDRIVGNEKHGGETYSILSYANGPSANLDSYEKQSSKYGKYTNDGEAGEFPASACDFDLLCVRKLGYVS